MRRILMYLILAGSITVFAQLQLQDMETAGDARGLAEQSENEPGDKVTPAQGQSDSAAAEADASSTSGKLPVSTDDEYASKVEHQGENEGVNEDTDEAGDSQPSEEEFKPAEEISEDYPVPLPSDI